MKNETKTGQSKTYLPPNAAEIAAAAPLAASGLVGGEFWDEVEQRLNGGPETPKIEPRPVLPDR